jgi:hypothetical protein
MAEVWRPSCGPLRMSTSTSCHACGDRAFRNPREPPVDRRKWVQAFSSAAAPGLRAWKATRCLRSSCLCMQLSNKREAGTHEWQANSRCANDCKALRNHQSFRDAIGRDQEDKCGQDDGHGDEAVVETTTESVEPLGQISPSLAHGRVSLPGQARITGRSRWSAT